MIIDSLKDKQDQTSDYKIHIDFFSVMPYLYIYMLTDFYSVYTANLSDQECPDYDRNLSNKVS